MRFNRATLFSASCLAFACSSDPLTSREGDAEIPVESAPPPSLSTTDAAGAHNPGPPALGSATLGLEGEDLILDYRNLTDSAGTLRASALVEGPDGLFATESRELGRFEPGESPRFRLPPADVAGLDVRAQPWTDARVNFEYELDDGRLGGDQVSLFAEHGKVTAPREVISSGKGHGAFANTPPVYDTVKAGETFSICFSHVIAFADTEPRNIDYFRSSGSYILPAYGIAVRGTVNGVSQTVYSNGTAGCATFPRTPGSWTFTVGLDSKNFPTNVSEFRIVARNDAGSIPTKQLGPFTVTSSTTALGGQLITMAAGDDTTLQHMFAMTQHTIRRAMSLGTVLKPNSTLTLKFTTGSNEYIHSTRTVLINRNAAKNRGPVSHEVGHWIHRGWMTTTSTGRNDTYCTPGGSPTCTVPPADGCSRTPGGSHGQEMIEWDSVAHLEGIADFFRVLAFNNTTEEAPNGGANCVFPGWALGVAERLWNCDAVGLYLKTGATGGNNCYEWTRSIFNYVGNEYDWTKAYWDLFADEVGLGNARLRNYLAYEEAATGWGKGNHNGTIRAPMKGTAMESAFLRACAGNIWDGTTH
ncbi:MAG: hypothetical protein M3020_06840 [Myxococcota bacterium]|nr:hypothetical protein [Myxococcota bacterium]